jgi:hypothetical protein
MASLPDRQRGPSAAIEGLDRGAPGQAQRPFGPKLEDGIAAPEHFVRARGRLRVENDLTGRSGRRPSLRLSRRRRLRLRHPYGPYPRSRIRRAWLRDRRARSRRWTYGGVGRPDPDARLSLLDLYRRKRRRRPFCLVQTFQHRPYVRLDASDLRDGGLMS